VRHARLISTIVRHEWRLLMADRTLWLAGGVFLVLGAYAIASGLESTRAHRSAVEAIRREHGATLIELGREARETERTLASTKGAVDAAPDGARDPSHVLAASSERNVVLPPLLTEGLDRGRSELYPNIYSIRTLEIGLNPYAQAVLGGEDATLVGSALETLANPLRLLIGRFDLAFVIVYVYPLLIFVISYNMVSSEREGGTLGLLLSQPVGLRTLTAGKLIARAPVVIGPAIGLSAVGLWMATDEWHIDSIERATLWAVVVALYGALWCAVALWVDATCRRSAKSALALASLWTALAVIAPALVGTTVVWWWPTPTRVELVNEIRRARSEARSAANEEAARSAFVTRHADRLRRGASLADAMSELVEEAPSKSAVLHDFLTRHPDLAGDGRFTASAWYYVLLAAQEEEVDRRTRAFRQRFATQLARRRAAVSRLSLTVPPLMAQRVFQELAGSSDARYERFFDQAVRFQQEQRAFFWPRLFRPRALSAAEHALVPRFVFREEPFAAARRRLAPSVACLVGLVGLTGALAYRACRHQAPHA
jgi:ABC-2 type transport system permease protein